MSNNEIKKNFLKAKHKILKALNLEKEYPLSIQGDQICGTVTALPYGHVNPADVAEVLKDNLKNRNYTNTDKQGEVLPHEANLLYGRVEENKEPVIEADITGKPESKKFSWKQNKDTNESASLGMESLGLTNEAVYPRLINAYEQVGYDTELSNPTIQKYRKLYQQDIDRYKKMIDLGLIKVDEPTIFNEEALMRRLDPNYISPEVQKYLYNIDDIGTGKMFEGFNGQW